MPAKNPRVSITLSPLVAAQLRRISELTGNSQSALVAELLDGNEAVFARLIRVLEAANEARASLRESLNTELELAQGKLERQMHLVLDLVDHHAPLIDPVEQVQRRAGRGMPEAPASRPFRARATPLSNRGVRSDTKTGKSPIRTRT